MILLHNIIQVLALSNLDTFIIVFIVLLDSCRVSAALIDVDQTWLFYFDQSLWLENAKLPSYLALL